MTSIEVLDQFDENQWNWQDPAVLDMWSIDLGLHQTIHTALGGVGPLDTDFQIQRIKFLCHTLKAQFQMSSL